MQAEEIKLEEFYSKFIVRKVAFIIASVVGLVILGLLAEALGAARWGKRRGLFNCCQSFPFAEFHTTEVIDTIVWKLRLPRIVWLYAAGAGLSWLVQ